MKLPSDCPYAAEPLEGLVGDAHIRVRTVVPLADARRSSRRNNLLT
jgi:hypothetical protein